MMRLDREMLKATHPKLYWTDFITPSITLEALSPPAEHYEIKKIMQEELQHLRVDKKLANDIAYYLKSYINRNEEHVNFFGGNLTGVNKITFSSEDRNFWLIDLLNLDDKIVKNRVRQLEHIGDNWVRGTDALNLGLLYLIHLFHHSKLDEKTKRQAILDCLVVIQIKFLSSLLHGYFSYPCSEALALAVYEELSRKFYIKKYGTWLKILEARAEDIYTKGEIHYKTIETYESDENIQYFITDVQTRIKSMVLNIFEVTMRLKEKGVGVGKSNMLVEQFGKIEVRDIERHFDEYLTYLYDIMQEPRAFIKAELIEIITDSITTMPGKLLNDCLVVISTMSQNDDRKLSENVREVMIYFFDYLKKNNRSVEDMSNLGQLVLQLKSLFTASKTNSSAVIKLRDYFDNLVKKNIKNKNPATISGVRTGIVLYLILRTLTKQHYG